MRTRLIGIALATLVLIAPAYSDAIFTLGNHHQPNEENIMFHTDQTGLPGTPIGAITNLSNSVILYESMTDTIIGTGGQSDVDAVGGLIHNITMTVTGGHTFVDAIINPFKPVNNNDLVVTVVTNTGPFMFTYGDTHGNNFLTITTSGGETISSVTIDSASGFQDLKQPRISGISGVTIVPEPSSLALLGSGVLVLTQLLRRKLS